MLVLPPLSPLLKPAETSVLGPENFPCLPATQVPLDFRGFAGIVSERYQERESRL